MVTTVYLVRHGETDYNLAPRYQGQLDIPLNEQGKHQGDLLGQAMKELQIDGVFSSPLSRAMETARYIAKYHEGCTVTAVHGLEEVDVGRFSGQLLRDMELEYPGVIRCLKENPAQLCYPEGESCREVYDRMVKTVGSIVEQNRGRSIAIVSHGFAIQNYIHFATGKPFEEMYGYIVTNTAHCKFVFEENSKRPRIEYLNCHDHLSEDEFSEWLKKE